MKKYIFILLLLTSCAYESISEVPMQNNAVGNVYKYEGRANYSHQIKKADTMMINHCKKINGGSPVILHREKRDIGLIIVGGGIMTNYNQEILYTCKN